MKVSIVIKALNEEKYIAQAIESSLIAIEEVEGGGEVILADSLSTDNTIKIASTYPIKILQLVNESDRSCGIGAELGREGAVGEYIYILDADMVLKKGFLPKAINELEKNKELAGVAGFVNEMHLDNVEFQERAQRKKMNMTVEKNESHLSMGGLYRASALNSVKYFTHQGLNSYEEFELGARLSCLGWTLVRLGITNVEHYGHQMDAYKLLIKRVKSGYIYGIGELLRSAYGQPHFGFIFKNLKQIKLFIGYLIWLCLLLVAIFFTAFGVMNVLYFIILFLMPFLVMIFKKRSIKRGIYSVVSGVFNTYGLVIGLLKGSIKNPVSKIKFKWIKGG